MALEDSVWLRTRGLAVRVEINSVPIIGGGGPSVLALEYGDAYDTPPYANVTLNTIPSWLRSGLPIEIDAGFGIDVVRQFTGDVTALPGEEPEFLRDQIIVEGPVIVQGTAPDEVEVPITATATLEGADIRPPLPAGSHIAARIPNPLIWTAERASIVAQRVLTDRGRVPAHPGGAVDSQTIECDGPLYRLMRQIEMVEIDAGGMTDVEVIELVLDRVGITDYVIEDPPDGAYTLADDAQIDAGTGADQLSDIVGIGGTSGLQFHQTASGTLHLTFRDFFPAPTEAFRYSTSDPDEAYIISTDGVTELAVAYNPLIQKGMTIHFEIPHLNVDSRYFVYGVRHVIPQPSPTDGPTTYMRLRGGNRLGGTVSVNPVAAFTVKVRRQVVGNTLKLIYTLDGSPSISLDGTITDWDWTIDTGDAHSAITTVPAHPLSGKVVTFSVDPADIVDGKLRETLTVTGSNGLTHAAPINLPHEVGDSAVDIAPFGVAAGIRIMVSPNGGETYNKQTETSAISCAAIPSDGVHFGYYLWGHTDGHIERSIDSAAAASATVTIDGSTTALGSPINCIQWDYRNTAVAWAVTHDCRVLRSGDYGATFTTYVNLRTSGFGAGGPLTSGLSFAQGSYVGNGTTKVISLSFTPKAVVVKGDDATGVESVAITRASSGTAAKGMTSGTVVGDEITLGASSFTVDNTIAHANKANVSGRTYYWYAIGGSDVAVGTYTGHAGGLAQSISGIGLTPQVGWVYNNASGAAKWRSSDMAAVANEAMSYSANFGELDTITSLDTDGFSVGTDADVNTPGNTYVYVMIKANPNLQTGWFYNDGVDNKNIGTSFEPQIVHIKNDTGNAAAFKVASLAGDAAFQYGSTAQAANMIQSFSSTGFQLGNSNATNNTSSVGTLAHFWFAIGDGTGGVGGIGVPGAIAGRRCIGLPFAGGIYIFGGTGTGKPMIAYEPIGGATSGAWVNQTLTGHIATDTATPADATMRIMDATAPGDGVTSIILEWASGGAGTLVAIYASISPPGLTADYSRATGLTAGLKNGRCIVNDAPLAGAGGIVRYAMFGDRDVWVSTDAIAFTRRADLLPAGYTFNDCLFESDQITGLIGMQGVYLIAAENSAGDGGVFKSVDALQTIDPIYGAGATYATPAWTTGTKPKMIAQGAPGATINGDVARIALVHDAGGATTWDISYPSSDFSVWTTKALSSHVTHERPRPFCLSPLLWFVTNTGGFPEPTSKSFGDECNRALDRSPDGGVTWAASAVGDETCTTDRAASGDEVNSISRIAINSNRTRVWGARQLGTTNAHPIRTEILYSDSGGATGTWVSSFIHTGASFIRYPIAIVCHPTNPNIVCVFTGAYDLSDDRTVVLMTSDGGDTWNVNGDTTTVASGNNFELTNNGDASWFVLTSLGRLIVNNREQTSSQIKIYTSDDYGETWVLRYTETQVDEDSSLHLFSKGVGSQVIGLRGPVTSGDAASWAVFSSPDGGSTWNIRTLPAGPTNFVGDLAVVYDEIDDAFIITCDSSPAGFRVQRLREASSSGETWENLTGALPGTDVQWEALAMVPRA